MKINENLVMCRVFSYLKPFKKKLLVAGSLLLIATGAGFFQPLVIKQITDEGMVSQNLPVLCRSVIVLALLVFINQIVELSQTHIFIKIHNQCFYTIFHQVFQKLMHLRKAYFEDKSNAEILNCLQMDVSQVASVTDRYTVMSVSYVFRIVSGLAGLIAISWKLTLIVVAMVPLKIILVNKLARHQEQVTDEVIESDRDFAQWFGDNLEGIEEIKLWNTFESQDIIFQKKLRKILKLQKVSAMIDAQNTLWESLLEWSVIILLYLVGGIMICQNNQSIGSVFAFISYSWYITGPVSALLNLKMYFARIKPSANRLFKFLDMESEQDDGIESIKRHIPRLEFKDVAFSYQEKRAILSRVSFYVDPGEKVAIIGQNGSGKSTILNLLLRLYTPDSGAITADGVSIFQFPLDKYRSLFSVVSQEPYLFIGDIVENIDLVKTASKEDIENAVKVSGVGNYVQRMPEGLLTQIGRNGARLSGGEKQKLAVARAMVKDAPIVIFDEATSSFDVESDAYFRDVVSKQMKDKSVILITHHYEDLSEMDRVYRLTDGILTEIDLKGFSHSQD